MGTRLSGSRLPIARHCAWAFREDAKFPEEKRSRAATDGTRLHDAFAEFVDHGHFPPLAGTDKLHAEAVRFWWDEKLKRGHGKEGWRAEVAYGLITGENPSAVEYGTHIGRNYPEDGRVSLTVDYEGIENGLYVVGDFKTGFGAHVEAPEDNLQLLAGAAAGSMVADSKGKITQLGAKIEIAHVGEDGVFPRIYIASPFALMRALEEIHQIQQKIPNAVAIPGEHCTFCPARGACPATSELVAKAVATRQYPIQQQAIWTTEFVSVENDALLVDELSALKKAIESIEASLKDRYRNSPLPLRDGKIYKCVVCSKQSFDKDKAADILGPRYKECLELVEYEQFRRVKV